MVRLAPGSWMHFACARDEVLSIAKVAAQDLQNVAPISRHGSCTKDKEHQTATTRTRSTHAHVQSVVPWRSCHLYRGRLEQCLARLTTQMRHWPNSPRHITPVSSRTRASRSCVAHIADVDACHSTRRVVGATVERVKGKKCDCRLLRAPAPDTI